MAEDSSPRDTAKRVLDALVPLARRQERKEELKELIREAVRDTGIRPSEEYDKESLAEGFEVPQPGEGLIDKIWRIENRLFQIQSRLHSVSTKLSWVLWGLAGLVVGLLIANR